MKRAAILILVLATGLATYSCATEGYNTQKGAALGAIGGALAGQAIGRNTAGTLIGAAGGALVGAIAGNAVDQERAGRRMEAYQGPPQTYGPAQPPPASEAPPGEWVTVPGRWQGGRWVPAHRVWVPVNP
jgi:uncharacterized membrane protein YebE (DUF533 family)